MTQLYVVTGAGPVGWTVAEKLAARGDRVRILTRSGAGPDNPGIERIRVDVSDPHRVQPAFEGAEAVFHCIHGSAYTAAAWEAELPRAEQVVLEAAGQAGAVVVFPESLYSYDQPDEVMTERSSRKAVAGKRGVRTLLLRQREASATATVSMVASDFYGPRVRAAHAGERIVPRLLAGKTIRPLGNPDLPHSFTYVPDLAAAMIAAAARKELWNSVLHAPTTAAPTFRGIAKEFARAAGSPEPRIKPVPGWMVRLLGKFPGDLRELSEMLYQFENPFVMDSAHSEVLLGLRPTPLQDGAAATVSWWQGQGAVPLAPKIVQ
ncbi:NAD-dependent epimerase/dehydratase family protein [Arthrobacter tumbae]|uniref:NAD-dependent epimerase/dehydratase family protein n=1 Tax=Arthrobacter tumbae TaxID=163874 RepID=UPI00195964B3|nr:NAD-dependent epimerase/dehydratase family protein [Arthrobacter tumbae]MBM7780699.1 nucleoside-diphosphate-sugar epimerase [Arthrobacter tumbae]